MSIVKLNVIAPVTFEVLLLILVYNYSKIHIVDPRYYNIDLKDYLNKNPNIKEALFIHNIQSLNLPLYKLKI